jgi:RND family efflux transporter MFP subunit
MSFIYHLVISANRWPHALKVISVMLVFGLVGGCTRPQADGSQKEPAQAASAQLPTVKVAHPQKKDVRRFIDRPGYNIEAYERTPLYAKIASYVLKWNFDIGDSVKGPKYDSSGKLVYAGDVLAELYIPEMDVEFTQKKATVLQAAAEIEQAGAAVLRAEADLKRAKSQSDRLARLGRDGTVTKEEVEEARLGFEAAQAALAKAQADKETAAARKKVAEADRDRVETLLEYRQIRAPFDGVVTRRAVNTKDFVQPAAANKGESLFVVERIQPVRVFIHVQEPDNVWVREGDVALIRVKSLQGRVFESPVTRTSKSLNPQNRTLRTEIDLDNKDGKLLPGMFVDATIIAEHKGAWSLPAKAIMTTGDETFCYRVEKGRAIHTPLQIGMQGNERDNELVEVLKKQIKPPQSTSGAEWQDITGDEIIIATDPASLQDGQAVQTTDR